MSESNQVHQKSEHESFDSGIRATWAHAADAAWEGQLRPVEPGAAAATPSLVVADRTK